MSSSDRRHGVLRGHGDRDAVVRRGGDQKKVWLSLEDFCEELEVPRSTAYKWCAAGPASGKFPRCRKLPNGRVRIRRDWLEEWVDGLPTA
jgi:predicted DNA-binding transcriptional regulator AlpA